MKFSTTLALTTLFSLAAATPLVAPVHQESKRSAGAQTGRLVIYSDDYISATGSNSVFQGLPPATALSGYTHLILAFLLVNGPADQCQQWKELGSSDQKTALAQYQEAGVLVMASALGSTETPTTDGVDASSLATTHANFVLNNNLHGLDVDYEDMEAVNKANGAAEQWLITYTKTLRSLLPAGQYLITHAPVAPWFSPVYTAGAYWKVSQEVGDLIDFYNIQFYNQGDTEYTTCNGLLYSSSSAFPETSVTQINTGPGKVPLNKIVIGKPSAAYQASNGFVDFGTLATCINDVASTGWNGGVMFWEYETGFTTSTFSSLAAALAKLGGNVPAPPSPSSTASTSTFTSTSTSAHHSAGAHTPTSTSSSAPAATTSGGALINTGGCNGVPAWSSTEVYSGGTEVSSTGTSVVYDGWVWQNKWWTQGDTPGTEGDSDPWAKVKACSSARDDAYLGNVTRARRVSHDSRRRRSHLARLGEIS